MYLYRQEEKTLIKTKVIIHLQYKPKWRPQLAVTELTLFVPI